MKIVYGIDCFSNDRQCDYAVTIGTFDGFHLGHRNLIDRLEKISCQESLPKLMLTFLHSPKKNLTQKSKFTQLFSLQDKIQAAEEQHIDQLIVQTVEEKILQMTREIFYARYLRGIFQMRAFIAGHDFCFGYNRLGDKNFLRTLSQDDGWKLDIVCKTYKKTLISSSLIRQYLRNGDIDLANAMLGRFYRLTGTILPGKQQGRLMGFPTMNLGNIQQMLPKYGVYSGFVMLKKYNQDPLWTPYQNFWLPALINIGYRPTMGRAEKVQVEGYIINTASIGECYDKPACFYLKHFLREERCFPDRKSLCQQINRDLGQAASLGWKTLLP